MKNSKLPQIILYLFIRYIVFFVFLMFKDQNTKLIEFTSLKSAEDWFYHLWVVLFLPVLSVVLFTIPLYLAFRVKKPLGFITIVLAILVIDYFIYVFFTSDKHIDSNGIYNALISAVLLFFFFRKSIIRLFAKSLTA